MENGAPGSGYSEVLSKCNDAEELSTSKTPVKLVAMYSNLRTPRSIVRAPDTSARNVPKV